MKWSLLHRQWKCSIVSFLNYIILAGGDVCNEFKTNQKMLNNTARCYAHDDEVRLFRVSWCFQNILFIIWLRLMLIIIIRHQTKLPWIMKDRAPLRATVFLATPKKNEEIKMIYIMGRGVVSHSINTDQEVMVMHLLFDSKISLSL